MVVAKPHKISKKTKEMNQFKFIDLFAGIGGFHIALHKLGAECVFADTKPHQKSPLKKTTKSGQGSCR